MRGRGRAFRGQNKSQHGVAIKRMRMFCISKNQCINFTTMGARANKKGVTTEVDAKIVVKCLFIFYVHSL